MQVLRASDQSVLIRDCEALPLFRALRRSMLPGVTGLSPTRSAVLIRFDLRRTGAEAVEEWVRDQVLDSTDPGDSRLIEIPTRYGGPDLDAVAEVCRLRTSDVVDLHCSVDYTAYFLGFMPGFAYLGEVPEGIRVPRLASPRVAVRAGSVGIAGRQTGVYPVECPGGWRLIGHTDVTLFDGSRGASLISPGDRVRFVPV